jgi:hypothetical protein
MFEKLRENILLDTIETKILAESLARTHDRLLSLVPVNPGNDELIKSREVSREIAALKTNNIAKYNRIMNETANKAQNLIKVFETLEKAGVFSKNE